MAPTPSRVGLILGGALLGAWGAGCVPAPMRAPARGAAVHLTAADRAIHRGRTEVAEKALAAAASVPRLSAPSRAELKRLEGELRLLQGRPADARAAFEAAREAAAAAYGPVSPEAAAAALDVADAHAAAGDFREAERLYRAAAEGHGSRGDLAERLSELALASQARGRTPEAGRLYRAAAEETERALGKGDPLTAARLTDWGLHLERTDKFPEAEGVYRRALGILEKVFPPGHARRDAALNALGLFLEARGRYAEAEAHYQRALREAAARRSAAARNFASLLRRLGRDAEAAALEGPQRAGPP